MGKLGVREKSLIHQVERVPVSPVPGFGTSFLPFAVAEDTDDRGDSFPLVTNFTGKPSSTTTVTNLYAFPSAEADDGEQGVPGGVGNFGGSTGGGSVTNNYVTNNYISTAQEPDDPEPSPPFAIGNFNRGGPTSNLRAPGCNFITSGLGLPLSGTLADEATITYGGTITAWTIVGDLAGSASILVEHATYSAYDTMTTLFTATCSTSKKAQSTGLSFAIAPGDVLRFTGSGFSTFTRCNITLSVTPS